MRDALAEAIRLLDGDASMVNRNGRLNAGRPWTAEDNEQLAALWQAAMPLERICDELERQPRGVRNQLLYLGIIRTEDECPVHKRERVLPQNDASTAQQGKRWRAEDEALLTHLCGEGKSITEIAKVFSRTERAVAYEMVKLKLMDELPEAMRYQPKPWPQEDQEELRVCRDIGLTLQQTATRFGVTETVVHQQLKLLED